MLISANDVKRFKTAICDENHLIPTILKDGFVENMPETILDVGAGLGDIAANAFSNKKSILLDPLDYPRTASVDIHHREKGGFFEFVPSNQAEISTLFFCHSLQFLDDSVESLAIKTEQISPKVIVIVANTNQDLLGKLINELESAGHDMNAEVALTNFPPLQYQPKMARTFCAHMKAPSFEVLANSIAYLVDRPNNRDLIVDCQNMLKKVLIRPDMDIEQTITLYST